MTRLSVMHTPDGLRAFLAVPETDGGTYPEVAELEKALRERGVVYGIDKAKLQEMAKHGVRNIRIQVAEATPSVPPVPGRLDVLVNTSGMGKPRERQDGSVDHRDLNLVINVQAGDPLVRRIPPVPGKEGTDVFGKPIKVPPPQDVKFKMGTGTEISSDDPNLLVAAIDGAVIVDHGGRVEVRTEKVIHGDIDYSTGNVTFNGDLRVAGTVRAGFEVSSKGKLTVSGNVEETTVISKGDLEVAGGAAGSGKGELRAGGCVTIRYAENFRITAEKGIVVTEDAMHCKILTKGMVQARSIVGGILSAAKGVEAENLGNNAEVKTVVDVGGQYLLTQQKNACLRKMTHLVTDVGTAKEEMYGLVRDSMDESGKLSGNVEEKLGELREKRDESRKAYGQFQERTESIEEQLKNLPEPIVKARNIYPNTVVRYGNVEKLFREPQTNTLILFEDGKIVVSTP